MYEKIKNLRELQEGVVANNKSKRNDFYNGKKKSQLLQTISEKIDKLTEVAELLKSSYS